MPLHADIYYHVYQEGEQLPVILIHGAGGNHLYWPAEIRRLAGYQVIALDLPGHGKSGGRGQQSIRAYAEQIMQWAQALHLPRAVVVGHSMGGAIALELALKYPEQVLGLCLVGTSARLRVSTQIFEESAHPTTYQRAIDTIIEWSFSPSSPQRLKELAAQRMVETRQTVLYGDFLACQGFDVSEQLAEIQLPALVICGEQDRMTPVRHVQFLADHLPQGRLEIVPDAGHMVMLEQPLLVAALLREFLSHLSR
jgi:pimeloyl-ACP methyl ester carboxylesterase